MRRNVLLADRPPVLPMLSKPGFSHKSLPVEPDENFRLDEQYDHESRMFYMLYSLKGNGEVDYVTARSVQDYSRSVYGNPVYYTSVFRSCIIGTTPCLTTPKWMA